MPGSRDPFPLSFAVSVVTPFAAGACRVAGFIDNNTLVTVVVSSSAVAAATWPRRGPGPGLNAWDTVRTFFRQPLLKQALTLASFAGLVVGAPLTILVTVWLAAVLLLTGSGDGGPVPLRLGVSAALFVVLGLAAVNLVLVRKLRHHVEAEDRRRRLIADTLKDLLALRDEKRT